MLVVPPGVGWGVGEKNGGQYPWWGEEGYQPSALESSSRQGLGVKVTGGIGSECLCFLENSGFLCPPLRPAPALTARLRVGPAKEPSAHLNLQELIEAQVLRSFEPIEPQNWNGRILQDNWKLRMSECESQNLIICQGIRKLEFKRHWISTSWETENLGGRKLCH